MVSVILLAAGSSTRFGDGNKLKSLLGGVPVFLHSLAKFYKHPEINEIVIVSTKEEIQDYTLLQKTFPKVKEVIIGGKLRQDSVEKGVEKVTNDIVLIHNGSNPGVSEKEINDVIKGSKEIGACVPGSLVVNTLKQASKDGLIKKTIPRDDIYEVQTPQGVNTKTFKTLIGKVKNEKGKSKIFTDDVSYFEEANLPVKIIPASQSNFKITSKQDLDKAQVFVKQELLIGIGHDSHKLILGNKPLTLGGIVIESDLHFEGNSDGDVLIHAICNAIGTAIGEGSLSLYSDKMCKDSISDSSKYLEHIIKEMKSRGYIIGNLAATIEGKNPKLEKHIISIKENLSKYLECNPYQIGIACTSGEELTSFGKGEGLQCFVNIILKKR